LPDEYMAGGSLIRVSDGNAYLSRSSASAVANRTVDIASPHAPGKRDPIRLHDGHAIIYSAGSAGGFRSMIKLLTAWLQSELTGGDGRLAPKGRLCGSILNEAERLVRLGRFGAQVNQLVSRACDVLDDMDESLVVMHPVRDAADFATAADLHRRLERIQAAIPAAKRNRCSAAEVGPT
jgi:hypothetical protein